MDLIRTIRKTLNGRALVGALTLSAFLLTSGVLPTQAQGMPVMDAIVETNTTKDQVYEKTIKDILIEGAVVALVSGVNYFTSQLAYSLAVSLTSECPGQKVCWDSKAFRDGFTQAWQGAIGESVGSLSQELGLERFGVDLCDPQLPGFRLQIALGLLEELEPPPPKCNLRDIINNYEEVGNQLASGEFLRQMAPTFVPGQAPLSVSLGIMNGLFTEKQEAEREAVINRINDGAAGGFSAISDPISGRVTAPAEVTRQTYDQYLQAKNKPADDAPDIAAGQIASRAALSVVINATQTFAQTLIARLWNRFAEGLLSTEELVAAQPDSILNPEALLNPGRTEIAAATAPRFTNIAATPRETGVTDMILIFSSCPSQFAQPMNCVMDSQFAAAVRLGDSTPLTVRDAIDQGYLDPNWRLISAETHKDIDRDPQCYTKHFCESNLKKLRAARIIPVGWELAAAKAGTNTTLGEVIAGFDDCATGGVPSAQKPWCHLIDPDWVLKSPPMQCRATVFGPLLLSPETPTRADTCVDLQSCLEQDDEGNCVGGYGYCTKEKRVWRFNGESCPQQFNTCTAYEDAEGERKSFLANTVDRSVCSAENVGCTAYATERNAGQCNLRNASGASIACTSENGCLCQQEVFTCTVSKDQRRCRDVASGSFCDLGFECQVNGGCACRVDVSCLVAKDARSCVTSNGGPSSGDDWRAASSIFVTGKAADCDPSSDGCTALIPLGNAAGPNLLKNPSFEELEDVNGDATPDHAKYWAPSLPPPAGKSGAVTLDANLATTGTNSIMVKTPELNFHACTRATSCTDAGGCVCSAPASKPDIAGYSCLIPAGGTECFISSYPSQWVPFRANATYTMAASFTPGSGDTVSGGMWLGRMRDLKGNVHVLPAGSVSATAVVEGLEPGYTARCQIGGNPTDLVTMDFSGRLLPGRKSARASCVFSMAGNVTLSSAWFNAWTSTTTPVYIDDTLFAEGTAATPREGYGAQPRVITAKVAPDSLRCTGNPGDSPQCDKYAYTCRVNELGCDLYTPTSGDAPVPAIVNDADRCPAECVGYDTYKQLASPFDAEQFPEYFIPSTARSCAAVDVGCSQFTDVDTEQISYFSRLRACVPSDDPSVETFYSWEGSDTLGYQLRVWRMKRTTGTVAPGPSDVCADGTFSCAAAPAPCTALDGDTLACASQDSARPAGETAGRCTRDDIDAGDLDCREYYDTAGNRHYRRDSLVVHASVDCRSFRITTSNETDCRASNGRWDAAGARCIYVADPSASASCSASANGCRAYAGNTATNVRTVTTLDFEGDLSGWTDNNGDRSTITLSSESVNAGGHSLKFIAGGSEDARAFYDIGDEVQSGRSYTLSFWARGTGTLESFLVDATDAAVSNTEQFAKFTDDDLGTNDVPSGALSSTWKQYTLGPLFITGDVPAKVGIWFNPRGLCTGGASNGNMCTVGQSGQCAGGTCNANSDVYLDNIVLKEVQDTVSLVRDSWVTPASCDRTPSGAPSPQYMLGCREYKTRLGATVTLRTFSQLCREQAVGCAAYADTMGTVSDPLPRTYGALCTLTTACGSDNGCACGISPIGQPLKEQCLVRKGETSCRFDLQGFSQFSNTDNESYVVREDRVRTLVIRQQDLCPASDVSCRVLGKPETSTVQRECTAAPLCAGDNEDGRQCVCLDGGPGAQTQQWGTQNRNNTQAILENANCFQTGDQADREVCTITFNEPTPASWSEVAKKLDAERYSTIRCDAQAVGCAAFKTSSGTAYFKDPGQRVCTYVERAPVAGAPDENGVSGWFFSGTTPQYDTVCSASPDLSAAGIARNGEALCTLTPKRCSGGTRAGQSCTTNANCPAGGDGTIPFCIPDSGICADGDPDNVRLCTCVRDNGTQCTVKEGRRTCGYEGWVGTCDQKYDRCEEFKDPNDTSDAGVRTYYYINDSRIDGSVCNGQVSLDNGCVLFDQTSDPRKLYDSNATYNASHARNGDAVSPVKGTPNTNRILKVRLDRECTEWLTCSGYSPVLDTRTGKFVRRCNEVQSCRSGGAGGTDFYDCRSPVQPEVDPKRLTDSVYAKARTGKYCSNNITRSCRTKDDCGAGGNCVNDSTNKVDWGDEEFSGFSVANAYSAAYLQSFSVKDGSGKAGICSNNATTTCDTDAECGAGGFCATDFFAVRRYAVVLDDAECDSDSDCTATAQGDAGVCVNRLCYYGYRGGQNVGDKPMCRAYPERDSPFSAWVVDKAAPGTKNGYDDFGQPRAFLPGYEGANGCIEGEQCECSYKRYDYGSVTRFTGLGGTDFGYVCVGGPYEGKECLPTDIDDPSTEQDDSACAVTQGGRCESPKQIGYLNGWPGLCLDQDKSRVVPSPYAGEDAFACNLWLPLDQLEGAVDLNALYYEAGYQSNVVDASKDLLYCQVAEGRKSGSADYKIQLMSKFQDDPPQNNDHATHTPTVSVKKNQISYIRVELETWSGSDPNPEKPVFILYPGNDWYASVSHFDSRDEAGGADESESSDRGCESSGDRVPCTGTYWHSKDGCGREVHICIRAVWSANGTLLNFDVSEKNEDRGGADDPHTTYDYYAFTRDWCTVVTKTTSNATSGEDGAINVAWTDRVIRGTSPGSGYDWDHTMPDTRKVPVKNQTPFGRVTQPWSPTANNLLFTRGTPNMSLDTDFPVHLWNTEGGSPYAGAYVSCDDGERTNDECNCIQPDYDGGEHTCEIKTDAGSTASGIPYACVGDCDYGGASLNDAWDDQGSEAAAKTMGANNISKFFAVLYESYQNSTGSADGTYVKTSDGIRDLRGANLASGNAPSVIRIDPARCAASVDGLCGESSAGLTITASETKNSGDITLPGEGRARVSIKYYGYADMNRMPVRRRRVSFGDGKKIDLPGWYKNHRGCKGGTCDLTNTQCDEGAWGETSESCEPRYFEEVHTYTCTPSIMAGLPTCSATTYACTDGTYCKWKPRVQLTDNWGTCNGTCPGGTGGGTCFNSQYTKIVSASTQADYGPAGNTNECVPMDGINFAGGDKPWTEYAGYIKLLPGEVN